MMRRLVLASFLLGTAGAAPVTFVKLYSDGAEIIQWVEQDGQLSGSTQFAYLQGEPPVLKVNGQAFTGVRQGNAVSLNFSSSFLGITDTQVWTGTLAGNALKLNRPVQGGGIGEVVLSSTNVSTYNSALEKLKTYAAGQQQVAQAAAADRAEVERQTRNISDADNRARRALSDASYLLSSLESHPKELKDAGKLFEDGLKEFSEDYQTLLDDAAEAKDCYDVAQVQGYDLSQLRGYDLSQLTGYATSQVKWVTDNIDRDAKAVAELLPKLRAAQAEIATLPAQNPRATATFSVSTAQLKEAETALSKQIAELQKGVQVLAQTRDDAIAQAQDMLSKAAQTAGSLSCKK